MSHGFHMVGQLERFEHVAEQMHLELPELATWLESVAAAFLSPREPSHLDERETRLLRNMEIIDRKPAPPEQRASLRAATAYVVLIESSYSLVEVAKRLDCATDEVGALARDGSLYAFEFDGKLLFPAFQFTSKGQVSGLRLVLRRLPRDLDPLEVIGFLNAPAVELETDGTPRTPLEWLKGGASPGRVVMMADELGLPS